ncbi:MAG: histidine kinase [Actinomycetota bacterium]
MKSSAFSLRRLRWKLTLSYTLVTVVALLALELLLASGVIVFLRSDLLANLIEQQIRNDLAPRLEEPLSRESPDKQEIKDRLLTFAENSDVRGADQAPAGEVRLGYGLSPDEGALFVVDNERRLLVTVPELGDFPEGRRFDAASVAGLEPLVDAALAGEENSRRLSTNTPEGRVLTATPVEDDEGRILGVIVGTLRLPNLTGPLLITVGISAIFLTIPAALLGMIFGFVTAWGLTRRLQRLVHAARAWSRGDFSVVVRDRSRDELGQLSRELNLMAERLDVLVQSRQELATLEARNQFARDLHDSVKQQVFATSLQLAAARTLVENDAGAAQEHLEQAQELVQGAQKELNVLIHEMRPAALEGKGLAAALRDYVRNWSEKTEIPASFHVRGERETRFEVEQALFRVAQEALSNVARHSGASRVEVDLEYAPCSVRLRVADDGRGFDLAANTGDGFGLQSMRGRLLRLGGRVEIESEPGKGTRVVGACPLQDSSGTVTRGRVGQA